MNSVEIKDMKFMPKIRPVGHREIAELLDGEVVVQEKLDGSCFAFGRTMEGKPFCLSRTQQLDLESNALGQFQLAVDHVKSIANRIPAGFLFRCECITKPRHNVLTYGRVPEGGLVLFDIERELTPGGGFSTYAYGTLEFFASSLGIHCAQELHRGMLRPETVEGWLSMFATRESSLGGPIEGIVIKNYDRFDAHGNILIGKLVRPEFKEDHRHKSNAEKTCGAGQIGARFAGPARWRKAFQYLQDRGELTGEMRDMPKLLARVREDVKAECAEEIKEALFAHYGKQVMSATTTGLAQWLELQYSAPNNKETNEI